MTKINKLVLHGFKSFAKRTEIPFGDTFNVVLGPNGSGKSNILDALCFVLGKSSAKALRSEKSANLLYNGGKSKAPAKNGEVSLFFDNTKKTFPTPEKEVKISRIVKANGSSVYKINDEVRTRQQILELLSLAKINPDGYNVILQGDIVRFVEMPPEERRMIVEQIAGISVYEEKKQKALNELGKVDEKMKESEIVMKERDSRLRDLKKEKEQAQEYSDLQHKVKINKASLLHQQMAEKNTEKEKLDQAIAGEKKELQEKQGMILGSKEKIRQFRTDIDGINKEVEQRGEKDQVQIHKDVEKLKVDIASSKNRIEAVKNEIVKIKQRKEQLRTSLGELEQKIKAHEQEKATARGELASIEKEKSQIEKRVGEFKKKNKLDSIADVEKEVDLLDKEAEAKQKEILDLRQKQQEGLREKDKLEFQIQAVDDQLQKILEVEKENQAQVNELKQKKQEFKKATMELSTLVNNDSALAANLATAKGKIGVAQEHLSKLQARTISIQESLEADTAVQKVLGQKNKIPGIHGTVSELGVAESKYALALEIAAGSRLKSIVVDTDKTAVTCIKFLKENKFGIASFIPMSKIKGPTPLAEMGELKKTNGAAGLAIDLLQFKPQYKNVFSYVFGNTLVVDDIDVARRIGIGRVKMVTLDGDLAELSGALQGGYRGRQGRGLGFQEKEVAAELEQWEKTMREQELVIARLEGERKKLEEQITRLRQFKADLEGGIITLEKILHLDTTDMDASRKVRKEFEKTLDDVQKSLRSVESTIEKENETLTKNRIRKQELRSRIADLRNPALVAELNAFEEKRKQLVDASLKKESDIKTTDSQISNVLAPERDNMAKIIKQHDKEEEDFKQELLSVEKLITETGVDLKQKEEHQRKFHEQFKELFTKRAKLDDSIKKEEEKIEDVGERARKIELKVNSVSIEISRISAELAAVEHEFKQYEGIAVVDKPAGELKRQITSWEATLIRLGSINMKALEIYSTIEHEYSELIKKKDKLVREKEDVLMLMNEIETKKKSMFTKTFDVVNENFKTLFSALSTKGEASLVLENPESPFDGGLFVKVRISGTRFLDIRSLSGGEKTMTALSFIFAIQEHEPASFYILDEVDAALDKRNSERFAQLIKKYTSSAQYVVITHNDNIIAEADRLYGISMDEHGVSQVTSLKV
ncbi:MAG: chromosome segregation protein SMC [Candidatus Woesearchaeota archaeon]|nr:chromosome segregation protein SMC [Candidatus Woesearchaeota archaeon]